MGITFRNYKLLCDFEPVSEFLRQNFVKYQQNGNIQQPYFEYAHTHPYFDHKMTHRFGIWEEKDCFGGNREFYECIGFEVVCHREKWNKVW